MSKKALLGSISLENMRRNSSACRCSSRRSISVATSATLSSSFSSVAMSKSSWQSETPLSSSRSEEHTSELQSRGHLVCRLLLEKKKKKISKNQERTNKNVRQHY